MGINVSRNVDLTENEYLQKFVGKDHIPINDTEFWNSLLQYHISVPSNSQEQLSLDSRLESLCQSFVSHNLKTGNFGSLITIFLDKVTEILSLSDQESTMHIWQAFNALFIIRSLVKYLIETGSEYQLLQHFEAVPNLDELQQLQNNLDNDKLTTIKEQNKNDNITKIDIENDNDKTINSNSMMTTTTINGNQNKGIAITVPSNVDGSKFEAFFEAIVNVIVIIPVKEFTYHLHLESVNTIITFLSVHLFSQQPTDKSVIFKTIYKCPIANVLTSALLHFISRMVQSPPTMFGVSSGGSFVFGIAESLLSIFTFRKNQDLLSISTNINNSILISATELNEQFKNYYPLANQSLLLLLILTNHYTTKDNSYRLSLFGCNDSKDSPKNDLSTFKIDFNSLYNTLCRIVTIDQATLLLYLLLHRNQNFYKFVMSQTNLQQLVIPILQTLYNAPDSTSHHIYMSLIVLLILSEDDGFNKSVHQIILKNVTWYTERSISEISLGGLLILVVIRTIQYNMLKMRDKYLHTNCLAALANMSGQFRSLHPYVAQRLISLFETLAKKHSRLDAQLKNQTIQQQDQQQQQLNGSVAININANVTSSSSSSSLTSSSSTLIQQQHHIMTAEEMLQDLNVLEEVLRMVLEILNSCLSNQLVYCPNLVYTLLYKRQVFESFRSHHAFQDIIQNIDMVVGFFSSRLQRVQDQRGELGVNEVLEVISKGASQWSSDRLRKFPDLKFKYVEEDAPEEFFIPYVWTLVTKYGCIHFSSESIKGVITDVAC